MYSDVHRNPNLYYFECRREALIESIEIYLGSNEFRKGIPLHYAKPKGGVMELPSAVRL